MARPARPGRFSIKWKIFAWLLGFCAILLVLLWLLQTVFLESFYKSIKKSEVAAAAREIAAAIEAGGAFWQTDVVRRGDLYVELWSEGTGGQTVPGNLPQGSFLRLDEGQKAELYATALESGSFVTLRGAAEQGGQDMLPVDPPFDVPEGMRHDPMGPMARESILYAGLVTTAAGEEMLLIVSAEITPVSATVDALRLQLLYVSLIMAALAILIGLLIARRVAGPIQRLNRTAGRWGAGEYDVVFEGGGYSEIAQLADTLGAAAAELQKTETLRRELVANVGHDLRTPLTLVGGYAEMMRDIPDENNPQNMQVLIDEVARLSGLVDDLMDYSRLEAGTGEIRPAPFNLTAAVQKILARIQKLSDADGYTFEFVYTVDLWANADEKRIAQVLYNFLLNAMAHTGEDKCIQLRQSEGGGRALIEVADHGPGIPPDKLPHIWQRYYKLGETHSRAPAGSGLGLSIAQSILRQHPGADYGVRSLRGEGSVFWFSLPLAEPSE